MAKLDGKIALITGGARGQGRSHAVTLAREGADIVICDIGEQLESVPYNTSSQADLDETVRQVEDLDRRCVALKADVRDSRQMQSVVDRGVSELGKIDILCANAGILSYGSSVGLSSWELSENAWDEMIDVNLKGVWQSCKAVIPQMIERGEGGSIMITSSTAGLKGFPGLIHYTAAKHGVVGIMRTLALELGPHNIRVNTIHPTGINTDMVNNEALGRFIEEKPEFANAMMQEKPLPVGMVEPVDISNAILWLASEEARYVTGVTLPVDAGITEK